MEEQIGDLEDLDERTIPRSNCVARNRESGGGVLITEKDPTGIHDP